MSLYLRALTSSWHLAIPVNCKHGLILRVLQDETKRSQINMNPMPSVLLQRGVGCKVTMQHGFGMA